MNMDQYEKLQEVIDEIVSEGRAVVFQNWNKDIRISINTVDKHGKPLMVSQQFTPEESKKIPMHELVQIVRKKLRD